MTGKMGMRPMAYLVSRRAYEFQKSYAINQNKSDRLRKLIENLWFLNEVIINPLEQSDTAFKTAVPILNITKNELTQVFDYKF
nr:hypothetical protein [uncultured Desulfobacter sp.]